MARVCLYISQHDFISSKLVNARNIVVSCDGIVRFSEESTNLDNPYKIFRQNVRILGSLTDRWCEKHTSENNTLTWCMMKKASSKMNSCTTIYTLRTYLVYLSKTLRDLTVCDGVCDKIVVSKAISHCTFEISNDRTLKKIDDPIILLEALSQAVYICRALPLNDVCIDINCLSIKCDGTILLPTKYIYTKHPVNYIAKACMDILSSWVARHRLHKAESFIYNAVDDCKVVRDVKDLYTAFLKAIAVIEGHIFIEE
jgi:hypothetical protein